MVSSPFRLNLIMKSSLKRLYHSSERKFTHARKATRSLYSLTCSCDNAQLFTSFRFLTKIYNHCLYFAVTKIGIDLKPDKWCTFIGDYPPVRIQEQLLKKQSWKPPLSPKQGHFMVTLSPFSSPYCKKKKKKKRKR